MIPVVMMFDCREKSQNDNKMIIDRCAECNKAVPNCSVCLGSIGIMNPYSELLKRKAQM